MGNAETYKNLWFFNGKRRKHTIKTFRCSAGNAEKLINTHVFSTGNVYRNLWFFSGKRRKNYKTYGSSTGNVEKPIKTYSCSAGNAEKPIKTYVFSVGNAE